MYKNQIHINLNRHRKNKKNHNNYSVEQLPCITIRNYKGVTYSDSIVIEGDIEFIYRPSKPLSCGAKMWIETKNGNIVYNVTPEGYTGWYDEDYLNARIDMYYKPGIEFPMHVILDNTLVDSSDYKTIEAYSLKVSGKVVVMQMYDIGGTYYVVETNIDAIKEINGKQFSGTKQISLS